MERIRSNRGRKAGFVLTAISALLILTILTAFAGPLSTRRERSSSSSGSSVSRSEQSRSSGRSSSGSTFRPSERSSGSVNRSTDRPSSGSVFSRRGSDRDSGRSNWPPAQTQDRYQPQNKSRSTYRPTTPSGSTYPNRTYRSSDSNRRSRVFERVGERNTTRIRNTYQPEHKYYYRNGYYRPYTGWRRPYYYSGSYYYTWPYTIEPFSYGYYVWDYDPFYSCRSVYYHYGYLPFIYKTRVVVEQPTVVYQERPIVDEYSFDDYYLTRPPGSVGLVLDDIKRAWNEDQPGLFLRYIRTADKIAVYLDGSYSYSIDAIDYIAMTRDAFQKIETVSFDFNKLKEHRNGDVTVYGRHRYYGAEDDIKTVYVSYTFRKIDGNWFIVEVGSSDKPLGN